MQDHSRTPPELPNAPSASDPRGSGPRRNVELKARLPALASARTVARRLATEYVGIIRQCDTYFHCPGGRLKLREMDTCPAELIWYDRPNHHACRTSKYLLLPVSDPGGLKRVLAAAYGLRAVVEKRREVFLIDNVRVHLDQVDGLGDFLEFEAVLQPTQAEAAGYRQLDELCREFSIDADQTLPGSYGDMMIAAGGGSEATS